MNFDKLQLGQLSNLVDTNKALAEHLEVEFGFKLLPTGEIRSRIIDKDVVVYERIYPRYEFLHITLCEMHHDRKKALDMIKYDRDVKTRVNARFNEPIGFKGGKPDWKLGRGKNKGEDDENNWAARQQS